jgi:hypothetical protein
VAAVERQVDGVPQRYKTKAFFLVTAGGPEGRQHQPTASVYYGRPQHFDILVVTAGNGFGFAPKIRVPNTVPKDFFAASGVYKIDVVATADETAPAFGTVCVDWRGARDTIKVWMEPATT